MKYEINTKVINGNLSTTRKRIKEVLNSFEGKEITLTIQKKKKRRSNAQNAYYWGVVIPLMAEAVKNEWGELWSYEKCHEFFKMRFLFTERVNHDTGEIIKIPKSTTENTTSDQEDYHTEIRHFMFEYFNVTVPLPNEQIYLEI